MVARLAASPKLDAVFRKSLINSLLSLAILDIYVIMRNTSSSTAIAIIISIIGRVESRLVQPTMFGRTDEPASSVELG